MIRAAHPGGLDEFGQHHRLEQCTAAAKREWFANSFPKQADQADQLLAAFDKRRSAVIRKAYQQDWCARGLYHMLLNAAMGHDCMISAVEGAASLRPVAETA